VSNLVEKAKRICMLEKSKDSLWKGERWEDSEETKSSPARFCFSAPRTGINALHQQILEATKAKNGANYKNM
jgi:hypothetical protein